MSTYVGFAFFLRTWVLPLTLLIGGFPVFGRAQIEYTSYSINQHEVTDVFFLDSRHGWILLEDHNLDRFYTFRTTDGGNTWRKFRAPRGMSRSYFLDANWGWGLKWKHKKGSDELISYLLRTEDGGRTWNQITPRPLANPGGEEHEIIVALAFMDRLHGWFVGEGPLGSGLVLQTSDGGKKVRRLRQLDATINSCLGVFAGRWGGVWIYGNGFVLHSKDRGKTWESPIDPENLGTSQWAFSFSSGFFREDGRGWLVGQTYHGIILGTEDFGRTWRPMFEAEVTPVSFENVASWDKDHACTVANPTLLFCTSDGGLTWKSRNVLPPAKGEQAQSFSRLVMLKSGRGWAMRDGGYLYESADGGLTWHELDLLQQPTRPEQRK